MNSKSNEEIIQLIKDYIKAVERMKANEKTIH